MNFFSFWEMLCEIFDVPKRNDSAKKVSVFMGRLQPPHIGHEAIIKSMKNNPIIVIVKGVKSSANKVRNPFDDKYQIKLLKKINPKAEIIIVKTGYLPEIFSDLRKKGMEVKEFFAGDDRMKGYKSQFKRLNLDDDYSWDIKWNLTPRIASATDVRNSLQNDDEKAFRKLMPKSLHKEYSKMKGIMNKV